MKKLVIIGLAVLGFGMAQSRADVRLNFGLGGGHSRGYYSTPAPVYPAPPAYGGYSAPGCDNTYRSPYAAPPVVVAPPPSVYVTPPALDLHFGSRNYDRHGDRRGHRDGRHSRRW